MRVLIKYFLVLAGFSLSLCACSQVSKGLLGKELNKDTVFVSVRFDRSELDSIKRMYGIALPEGDLPLYEEGEFVSTVYKLQLPLNPKGYTSDFIGLFTSQQVEYLDSLISDYEQKTSNEIAIVTIDSSWIKREYFDEFVLRIHNYWGVGKKVKNNGIVIGICPGHKVTRISNGYGIEKKLSDAETKSIIDSIIIPEYKKGDFFEGTKQGVLAIISKLK